MTINDRIKSLRKELRISQKEFATGLGFKQSYYSYVENGKKAVTSKVIEALRITYSVSSEWLYTGKGEKYLTNNDIERTPQTVPSLYPLEKTRSGKQKKGLPYSFYDAFTDSQLNYELSLEKQRFKDMYEDVKKLTEVFHKMKPSEWIAIKFPLWPSFSEWLQKCEDEFLELHSHLTDNKQIKIVKLVEVYQQGWDNSWQALSHLIEYMGQYYPISFGKNGT